MLIMNTIKVVQNPIFLKKVIFISIQLLPIPIPRLHATLPFEIRRNIYVSAIYKPNLPFILKKKKKKEKKKQYI